MVVGMLLAAGSGQRVGGDVPKQFMQVHGKPIVCYPLEIMDQNADIDAVEIVCDKGQIDFMREIVKEAQFKKVRWICAGGATCQESTLKGLNNLRSEMNSEDIVLIHMSSFPLAPTSLITDCINSAVENGNGCAAASSPFLIFTTENGKTVAKKIGKESAMVLKAPYAFRFGECIELYDKACEEKKDIYENGYTHTLYYDYGKPLFLVKDMTLNLKITTMKDIELMKAYLCTVEESEFFAEKRST